jgi:hypothetical protein
MAILQAHFGHQKFIESFGMFVEALISPLILNQQIIFFKLTMQNHVQSTMLPPHDCNPTTQLWERLGITRILTHLLL